MANIKRLVEQLIASGKQTRMSPSKESQRPPGSEPEANSRDETDHILRAGVKMARQIGSVPIVVSDRPQSVPDAPVVIVDKEAFANTAENQAAGSDANPDEDTNSNSAVVFAGTYDQLASAIAQKRVPSAPDLFVRDDGTWVRVRSLETFQKQPQAGREQAKLSQLRHRWYNNRVLNQLRANVPVRRLQPLIDKRAPDILETLIAPGDFPFRMQHVVSGRILFGTGGLYSGGAERQLLNTIEGLRDRGISGIHLLVENLDAGSENAFYLDQAKRSGATIVRPATHSHGIHRWSLEHPKFRAVLGDHMVERVLNTAETIQRISPEVVQASLDWTNITVGLAAVLAGTPHVFLSGRNLGPHHFEFFQWFMYPAYRALVQHPSVCLLNNSESGRDDYANWLSLPSSEVTVVRNGLHTEDFVPPTADERRAAREYLNIGMDDRVVTGVFRLSSEKRPLLWLEAAARIKKRYPDIIFLLCGSGNREDDVRRRVAKLGLADNLQMLGTRNDIQRILAASDLVLKTSLQEGTPNALIEAQAMGLPVVTTPAYGAAEAVEDGVTGTVVYDEKPAAIAKAVIAILEDQSRRERARLMAPEFIADRFGFDRMIDDTLQVYLKAGVEWTFEVLPDEKHWSFSETLSGFTAEKDKCWLVHLPELANISDNLDELNRSPLLLFEDGKPLGPAHCAHDEVRSEGGGRFSHWEKWILFSTSDDTSPIENGRKYEAKIRIDDEL